MCSQSGLGISNGFHRGFGKFQDVRRRAARVSGLPADRTNWRQMVEICKALLRNAKVIALDEPTSSLSHSETEVLFKLVRALRARHPGSPFVLTTATPTGRARARALDTTSAISLSSAAEGRERS